MRKPTPPLPEPPVQPTRELDAAQSLTRAQQRLHRQELKLARLTHRQNSNKKTREAMKRRLGNLLFLLNWQNETPETLKQRLAATATLLEQETPTQDFQFSGEQALQQHTQQRESDRATSPPKSPEQERELDEQRLRFGELMMTHRLDDWARATVFAALVQYAETHSEEKASA